MKKIVLLSVVLVMSVVVWGQDQKAKDILEKVSEKTRSYKTISADFVFSMQNKEMDINEKNEGSIKLKGQKYAVELPSVGINVFSDGKTLWNFMKEGNQVTISNMEDQSSELMDPSALFTIYEKGFDSKYIGEKKVDGKSVYEIELFPDSDEFDVSKISVLINKSSLMIQSASLFATDGNLYGIEVKKMETDKNYTDADFIFNPSNYKDIEVIDFR